jgi:polysaccharide pyruvyl transferase WcaK-like protein
LGWHGRGNLGDDAIRAVTDLALQGAKIIDIPLYPRETAVSMTKGLPLRANNSTLVLGGGTCIGRKNWRRLVQFGSLLSRGHDHIAVGVGVEDPVFKGYRSYSQNGELAQWGRLLEKFESITVRGPRSAELLSGIGVDASVVGDPALLFPNPNVPKVPGRIGINLGFGDDLWGHDPEAVAREVGLACRHLEIQGHSFVGVLFNNGDHQWTELALSKLRAPTEHVFATDSSHAVTTLASCSLVIASRLHAAILASVSATSVISLEYQPKCRDFALSIGNEQSLIRTDEIEATGIVDQAHRLLQDYDSIERRTSRAVDGLRGKLKDEFHRTRQRLGLSQLDWLSGG